MGTQAIEPSGVEDRLVFGPWVWRRMTHNPLVPGSSPGGPTTPFRGLGSLWERPGDKRSLGLRSEPCRVTASRRLRWFAAPEAADFLPLPAGNASLASVPDFRKHPVAVTHTPFDSLNIHSASSSFFHASGRRRDRPGLRPLDDGHVPTTQTGGIRPDSSSPRPRTVSDRVGGP